MTPFQILFVPLCALLALRAIARGWKGATRRGRALLGASIWSLAGIVIAVPEATSLTASLLGIGRGSDLVFYLSILVATKVFLYVYSRLRSLEIAVTDLIRRDAIEHARRGRDNCDPHGP